MGKKDELIGKTSMENMLWHDRKRIFFGLPWTFTKYQLSEERIFIQRGFFNLSEDECRLYRVLDVKLVRKFWQRLCGLGTIQISSSDKSLKDFELQNIKHSREVKEILSEAIEKERANKRVVSREMIHDCEEHDMDEDGMFERG